ncbi:hypothetical protein L596_006879 [Steinernema carpocapsae]|uniref:FHA domain-containing protein n=1 Tax=Steinernema carpocapsae TaxID=34508 RepID=A0A4U5P8I0_STECR|nr:hypothetical protein L596_006879 [Steinernema carpocapsae]
MGRGNDRSRSRSVERRRRVSPSRRGRRDGDDSRSVSPKRRRRSRSTEKRRKASPPRRRRSRSTEERRSLPRRRERSGSRDHRGDRSDEVDRRRRRSPSRSPPRDEKPPRQEKREPCSHSPPPMKKTPPSAPCSSGGFQIASLKKPKAFEEEKTKWGRPEMYEMKEEEIPPEEVEKPCFEPSGKLAEDTNTFKGVVIKYNEPPEARIPKARWRIYPFRGEDQLDVLYIHRQSAYMISREKRLGDILVEHPSCSKQHAVLQYRCVPYVKVDGSKARRVLPYIIDLGSANGTFLNGKKLDAQRYYELKENDILKFGFSSRDFLIMKEKSEKELAVAASEDAEMSGSDSVSDSD